MIVLATLKYLKAHHTKVTAGSAGDTVDQG